MELVYSFLSDYANYANSNKVNTMGIFDRFTLAKNANDKYIHPDIFFVVLKIKDYQKDDEFIVKLISPEDQNGLVRDIQVAAGKINESSKPGSLGGILVLNVKAGTEFSVPGEWKIQLELQNSTKKIDCGSFNVIYQ